MAANVPAATQPVMPNAVVATSAAVVAGPSIAETAPVTLTKTSTEYPRTARRRRLQGVVVVAVEVTADGAVQNVVVQRSSGHPVLDSAALDAVRNWRFTPARRAGQAVRAAVQVPIRFQITGEQVAGDATGYARGEKE
jgi:protein TonB